MHIQIIQFQLSEMTPEDYSRLCTDLAPTFAALPGLVSKTWLANTETGTFGGVYVWEDRRAMEQFSRTDLFQAVATHKNLTGITSKDFGVLESPSRVTRGMTPAAV